jgi:hypothetical protein
MPAYGFDPDATLEADARVRAELLRAVDGLPEAAREDLWVGQWTLGDIIAHVAGAQAGYAEALEHIADGEPPTIEGWEPGPPHDWNAATVAARRDHTWEQRLADLDAAQVRYAAAVRAIPAATYAAPEAGFPHQFSAARNSAEHFASNVSRHESARVREIVDQRRERGL